MLAAMAQASGLDISADRENLIFRGNLQESIKFLEAPSADPEAAEILKKSEESLRIEDLLVETGFSRQEVG